MSEITRVYYNKLVRDNIPDIIRAKRESCEVRQICDVQEFQQELFKKIKEEANSLAMVRTKNEFIGEYTDLMIVLDTIIKQLEISPAEIAEARAENLLKRVNINISISLFGLKMSAINQTKVRKEFLYKRRR